MGLRKSEMFYCTINPYTHTQTHKHKTDIPLNTDFLACTRLEMDNAFKSKCGADNLWASIV